MKLILVIFLAASTGLLAGCEEKKLNASEQNVAHKFEYEPMHHGTIVALGGEEYNVEMVLGTSAGKLEAYVMDNELENFVRIPAESFEVVAKLPGKEETLIFKAVANSATGETAGDTSQFEAQADWLKTTPTFNAVIKELLVHGNRYQNIVFNFPKGNDTDEK